MLFKNKKMRDRIVFIITILVTIIIFILLFARIKDSDFLVNIKNINIFFLMIAIIALAPGILLLAYRWKLMISDYKKISFLESVRIFMFSQTTSIITPSRVGEYGKTFFLRDKKFNLKIGTSAFLLEKIFDVFFIALFCFVGIMSIKKPINHTLIMVVYIVFFMLLAGMILLLSVSFRKNSFLFGLINKIIPFAKLKNLIFDMLSYLEKIKKDKKKLCLIFAVSFLAWFFLLFEGYLFFWAIGYQSQVSFFTALGLIPIGILIGMIPITIAGMGTRDAAFVMLFSYYVPAQMIIIFGLLFSLRYFVPALIGLIWTKRYVK